MIDSIPIPNIKLIIGIYLNKMDFQFHSIIPLPRIIISMRMVQFPMVIIITMHQQQSFNLPQNQTHNQIANQMLQMENCNIMFWNLLRTVYLKKIPINK